MGIAEVRSPSFGGQKLAHSTAAKTTMSPADIQ